MRARNPPDVYETVTVVLLEELLSGLHKLGILPDAEIDALAASASNKPCPDSAGALVATLVAQENSQTISAVFCWPADREIFALANIFYWRSSASEAWSRSFWPSTGTCNDAWPCKISHFPFRNRNNVKGGTEYLAGEVL